MFTFGAPAFVVAQPTSGKLYAWGQNTYGQLGQGDTTDKSTPVQIGSNTNWVAATSTRQGSFACNSAGKAYGWGWGEFGRTGLSNTSNYSTPQQIGGLTDWTPKGPWAVGGGTDFILFVKSNGTLWSWGNNNGGKLGLSDYTRRSSPTQVGGLTNWKQVSNTGGESSAIKTDGTLWSWGYGTQGRLGHNNTTTYNSPKQVGGLTTWKHNSQGSSALTATRTDGKLFTCGFGLAGQTGHNSTTNYSSPKQVGALTTWAYTIGGTYWNGAVKTDNTIWTWGSGGSGRLAQGSTTSYSSPVQVSSPSVSWKYAVGGQYLGQGETTDGFVWTWGYGAQGQIGNAAAANVNTPIQLGTEKWVSLSYVTHCQQSHLLGIR